MKKLENLRRWSYPANYGGETWYEYYSAGVGQSRDSDCLERSNFESMLRALGGETETVIVVREKHWAVGWVEWIAIHEKNTAKLRVANEIQEKLKDYPIVDESHLAKLEDEEAHKIWAECYDPKRRIQYMREHFDQFRFTGWRDLLACARGQHFAGYASELLR